MTRETPQLLQYSGIAETHPLFHTSNLNGMALALCLLLILFISDTIPGSHTVSVIIAKMCSHAFICQLPACVTVFQNAPGASKFYYMSVHVGIPVTGMLCSTSHMVSMLYGVS